MHATHLISAPILGLKYSTSSKIYSCQKVLKKGIFGAFEYLAPTFYLFVKISFLCVILPIFEIQYMISSYQHIERTQWSVYRKMSYTINVGYQKKKRSWKRIDSICGKIPFFLGTLVFLEIKTTARLNQILFQYI